MDEYLYSLALGVVSGVILALLVLAIGGVFAL